MSRFSQVAALAGLPLLTLFVGAQTSTYEVVTIYKSDPANKNVHMGNDGPHGGLRTSNTSVLTLIGAAYHVQDYQVIGAPAWAKSDRFDVTLTPDKTEVIPDVLALKENEQYFDRNLQRLQAVLHDRFGLVLHKEIRELPVYSLVVVKGGNKLTPANGKRGPSISTNNGRQIRATAATMDMLAQQLSDELSRPVNNGTGIQGQFDFTLNWTPDPGPSSPSNNPGLGPSIFTAINDQLGLKLESGKGMVPVYVIDKINPPGEN